MQSPEIKSNERSPLGFRMRTIRKRIFSIILSTILLIGSVGSAYIPVTALDTITPSVSIGGGFMVALNNRGELFAWGDNSSGTLGNGATEASSTPVAIDSSVKFTQISAGFDHVLALSESGRVYAWGSSEYGQLGINTNLPVTSPTPVPTLNEITCVAISAGKHFSLALTEDGHIYAWGNNASLQLGEAVATAGTQQSTPRRIPFPASAFFTEINAGYSSASAMTNDGSIFLWGKNTFFQLGTDTESSKLPQPLSLSAQPKTIALGEEYTTVLYLDGTLKSIGRNAYGQFGNAAVSENGTTVFKSAHADTPIFSAICAGEYHTVALTASGDIYTAGRAIGAHAEEKNTTFTKLTLPDHTIATAIFAGYADSAAITQSGTVLTWGENGSGQLGNGTNTSEAAPKAVKNSDGSVFHIGTTASMQSVSIQFTTTTPAPTYSVTIPSSIDLGVLRQTNATDENRIKAQPFTVSANGVSNLFDGQTLVVSVSPGGTEFVLTDPTEHTLPYEIHLTEIGGIALESGDNVASFTSDGTATAWIRVDQSKIEHSGRYQGILNFNISTTSEVAQ